MAKKKAAPKPKIKSPGKTSSKIEWGKIKKKKDKTPGGAAGAAKAAKMSYTKTITKNKPARYTKTITKRTSTKKK